MDSKWQRLMENLFLLFFLRFLITSANPEKSHSVSFTLMDRLHKSASSSSAVDHYWTRHTGRRIWISSNARIYNPSFHLGLHFTAQDCRQVYLQWLRFFLTSLKTCQREIWLFHSSRSLQTTVDSNPIVTLIMKNWSLMENIPCMCQKSSRKLNFNFSTKG